MARRLTKRIMEGFHTTGNPTMGGRFSLNATPEEVAEHFNLDKPPRLTPRFNIAPSQLSR